MKFYAFVARNLQQKNVQLLFTSCPLIHGLGIILVLLYFLETTCYFPQKTECRFCFFFREKSIAKELKQSKEDRDEIHHQLKEAIEQKIELSKQLEDWQAS